MPVLLDTNIAIHIREGNEAVLVRIGTVSDVMTFSMVTMIELHSGLAVEQTEADRRRAAIAKIRRSYAIFDVDEQVVGTYGAIVAQAGYARNRVFDRLIAATALVHDLTLVTINGADFRDIPGLKLEVWPRPRQ